MSEVMIEKALWNAYTRDSLNEAAEELRKRHVRERCVAGDCSVCDLIVRLRAIRDSDWLDDVLFDEL